MAWFTPLPPVRTGVAAVSAELIAALRDRGHIIDVYADGAQETPPARSAHDFVWQHLQQPYDLVVYQLGNSSHHDYAWAYALRYPGLVVLHDTRLHHARAAHLLRERRAEDYRAEFAFNEPAAPDGAAEVAIGGFDSCLYYDWPMVTALIQTARLVAVHGEAARRELIDGLATDDGRIVSIRLGHGEALTPERERTARRRVRKAHGLDEGAVVFGVFGGLTPEKRIPQILAAFRAILPAAPGARLLLAGAPAAHYDLAGDIATHGLQDHVTVAGYLDRDADLTDYLAACDVSVNLRWPTARETSGPWLRAVAAGRPTIITDLVHLGDVPSLDPRTWARPLSPDHRAPVCVAIDILDEDHSLRLALRRLALDVELRAELGRAAAEWWQREHSVTAMVEDYERIFVQALHGAPAGNHAALPAHIQSDGRERMRELLAPFQLEGDTL